MTDPAPPVADRTRRARWPYLIGLLVIAIVSFLCGARWGGALLGRAKGLRPNRPPGPARLDATTRPAGAAASQASPPASTRPGVRPPLPGEFERQSALIVGCNELVRLHPRVFVQIVSAAWRTVRLIGLVSTEQEHRLGRELLRRHDIPARAMLFVRMPLDSMWTRDYGPIFARRADGSPVAVDLLYRPTKAEADRLRDAGAAGLLGRAMGVPVESVRIEMEGGNLVTNGEGFCVTTHWLTHRNKRRGLDKGAIGQLLRRHFGARGWMGVVPLTGEPSGHADMMLTFLAPNVAVVGRLDAAAEADNAAILDKVASLLTGRPTSRGPMQVHRIPMPTARDGVWLSYTNVIFANGVLLVPTFSSVDSSTQAEALGLYARLMPDWRIVGINADSLAPQRGLLHCLVCNVPPYVDVERLVRNAR